MSDKYKKLFEGKFKETRNVADNIFEEIYYNFSSSTYGDKIMFRMIDKYFKNNFNARILDVGCGGGHKKLLKYGDVYGVDISSSSIFNAKNIYKEAIDCDITEGIPFEDNYFDFVFCSEVMGHIDLDDKDFVISEMSRVCKNNSLLLFSIETYGNNIITKTLKDRGLYNKYWVDYQGHIGLEKPSEVVYRLNKHFNLVECRSISSDILPIDGYLILKDDFGFIRLLDNNFIRRALNMVLYPFYRLSIFLSDFDRSNDIIVIVNNKKEK